MFIAATVWVTAFGIVAALGVGFGIFWTFNKKAKLRQIAELRKMLDHTHPSDPDYNSVRALYTSLVIDAHSWGFYGWGHDGSSDSSAIGHAYDGSHHSGSSDGGHSGDAGSSVSGH